MLSMEQVDVAILFGVSNYSTNELFDNVFDLKLRELAVFGSTNFLRYDFKNHFVVFKDDALQGVKKKLQKVVNVTFGIKDMKCHSDLELVSIPKQWEWRGSNISEGVEDLRSECRFLGRCRVIHDHAHKGK